MMMISITRMLVVLAAMKALEDNPTYDGDRR